MRSGIAAAVAMAIALALQAFAPTCACPGERVAIARAHPVLRLHAIDPARSLWLKAG